MANESSLTTSCATKELEALLHPLVVLNISDHWTRTKAQTKEKLGRKVYGALLGRHEGRHLEMVNSFELRMYEVDGLTMVNDEFLRQREEQYKEVFPEMELIGWYCTGDATLSPNDIFIQTKFSQFCECPVLLKLDPTTAGSSAKLPMVLWEHAGMEASSTAGLRPISWSLVAEESERIGVDHVTRLSTQVGNTMESETAKQIRSNNAAVTMLVSRVQLIHEYLVAVSCGSLPYNDEIVREANKLCQLLPRLQPADFENTFFTQENDVQAAILLSKMTEMCGGLGQLVTKVNQLGADRAVPTTTPSQHKFMKNAAKDLFTQRPGPSNAPDLFNI